MAYDPVAGKIHIDLIVRQVGQDRLKVSMTKSTGADGGYFSGDGGFLKGTKA